MSPAPSAALPFNPPFAEDDKAIAARLLAGSRLPAHDAGISVVSAVANGQLALHAWTSRLPA